MKNTNNCYKCNGRKVIKVPGKRHRSPGDNAIPVGWLHAGTIPVTRYVCCQCGYSEEWIEDPKHIKKLEESYDNHDLDDFV